MATIEQQVAGLVTDMQDVKTNLSTILTAVNALTAAGGVVTGTPTPAPAVDFTVVTDAITASQAEVIAEVQKVEEMVTQIKTDLES